MARPKQTKTYKKNRIKEAEILISEKFGSKSLGVLRKKYALNKGKNNLQLEIYSFLIDRGFNFSEIGKLAKKTHGAVRSAVVKGQVTSSKGQGEGSKGKGEKTPVGASLVGAQMGIGRNISQYIPVLPQQFVFAEEEEEPFNDKFPTLNTNF